MGTGMSNVARLRSLWTCIYTVANFGNMTSLDIFRFDQSMYCITAVCDASQRRDTLRWRDRNFISNILLLSLSFLLPHLRTQQPDIPSFKHSGGGGHSQLDLSQERLKEEKKIPFCSLFLVAAADVIKFAVVARTL
jgi:hypothetical protein